jgi:branched-subunit amino acid ABC-type transport system permease component
VQIGMGENVQILAFVIIVIGGVGSIRGASWRPDRVKLPS